MPRLRLRPRDHDAHSFGGIFARLYASTYPSEVVGMVLVDALSEKVRTGLTPEQMEVVCEFWIYETDARP